MPFFSSSESRGEGGGVAFWTTSPPRHGSDTLVPETSAKGMNTVVPWPFNGSDRPVREKK